MKQYFSLPLKVWYNGIEVFLIYFTFSSEASKKKTHPLGFFPRTHCNALLLKYNTYSLFCDKHPLW